jgi:hypothetical protein
MKIQQFIKSLNNTEIGKGGTHECYVLVSKKVKNINNIFNVSNYQPTFINLKNGGVFKNIHITSGREFRINGLGDFYRINNVNAGDEIIFERHDKNNVVEFFINLNTKDSIIIFQKNTRGFEVLNSDRLASLITPGGYESELNYKGKLGVLKINFKVSAKKRSDSPTGTDFYNITFDGRDILNDLKSNEYFELSYSKINKTFKKVVVWQSYEFKI